MSVITDGGQCLHAPAKREAYRKHLHEAATLCHRTGWIALDEAGVNCSRCLRRLARKRNAKPRDWLAMAR
jgi:hypothetical protein